VQLEGLGKLKKIHLIGIRTCDLPACSTVPQETTLRRAPIIRKIPTVWIQALICESWELTTISILHNVLGYF
jgi:hypothetical protein